MRSSTRIAVFGSALILPLAACGGSSDEAPTTSEANVDDTEEPTEVETEDNGGKPGGDGIDDPRPLEDEDDESDTEDEDGVEVIETENGEQTRVSYEEGTPVTLEGEEFVLSEQGAAIYEAIHGLEAAEAAQAYYDIELADTRYGESPPSDEQETCIIDGMATVISDFGGPDGFMVGLMNDDTIPNIIRDQLVGCR